MNYPKSFISLILFFLPGFLFSQVVVTVPVYPTDIDSVTVIFDATKGNAGLKDVPPPIYAHTGVITDSSTNSTDWRYVIAAWNQNIPKALMTTLGNNLYQIKMTPSIRAWYGVPQNEKILKLAFVFRNSDGSKAGREANGGDIFADVYPTVTSITITQPSNKKLFLKINDSIPVSATSPLADSIFMFLNNSLIKKVAGTTLTDTLIAAGQNWVKQWVRIVAKNDTAQRADSFYYAIIPPPPSLPLPPGITDGFNYIDSTTVVLSLLAPGKDHCFLIGSFNDWEEDSIFYMNRTPDGTHYWFQLNNLIPRHEYLFQYYLDGTLRIADPYSEKICDPDDQYISPSTYPNLLLYPSGKTTEIASYLQTAQDPYQWSSTSFTPPDPTDLVIYELLIRDFTVQHDYPSLIDTLNYMKRLGVNAIELMPVMEFEGNSSWGYNPDFEFAPDKYYGTKNGLKLFVEAAHAKGMAVILDIVLNHQFEQSPLVRLYWDGANSRPSLDNLWFNPIPKHPYNVGFDFNHESQYTKAYCERVIKYWITEFHVDGYRFDMSKGFTQTNSYPNNMALWGQYDSSRIAILKNYANVIHSVNPKVYVILEHFADNDEETELSADGMLLWGNLNYSYTKATGGWNTGGISDFSGISYEQRGWADPHLVGYMESHDEERVMYSNISAGNTSNPQYNIKDTAIGLLRDGMAATFFYTIPGPKMIWQFGELGYDYSINYPCMNSNCRLSPKPIRWDYFNDWRRRYLYNTCAALIDLKKNKPAFRSTNYSVALNGALKRISILDPSMNVVIVGNFDVKTGSLIPGFNQTGPWYDFFSGDTLNVTDITDHLTLQAGEYHLFTTVKLPKPLFTGLDEPGKRAIQESSFSFVYPNPSTGMFTIQFTIQGPAHIQLTVTDLYGRQLVRLFDGILPAGTHSIPWNSINDQEQRVPPGIYLYHLMAGERSETKKIIVQ